MPVEVTAEAVHLVSKRILYPSTCPPPPTGDASHGDDDEPRRLRVDQRSVPISDFDAQRLRRLTERSPEPGPRLESIAHALPPAPRGGLPAPFESPPQHRAIKRGVVRQHRSTDKHRPDAPRNSSKARGSRQFPLSETMNPARLLCNRPGRPQQLLKTAVASEPENRDLDRLVQRAETRRLKVKHQRLSRCHHSLRPTPGGERLRRQLALLMVVRTTHDG